MKIFISQLMRGRSEEEILYERSIIEQEIKYLYRDAEVIDSYDVSEGNAVYKLGIAIQKLSEADAVYFGPNALTQGRGCLIEFAVAKLYGIQIL